MPRTQEIMILCLGAACASAAHAQQLWIEQDLQGACVYVGDFGENRREMPTDLSESTVAGSARLLMAKADQEAALSRRGACLSIAARAIPGEALVFQGQADKAQRMIRAARWVNDFTARNPRLPLDLVPTGQASQVRAVFQGSPLPGAQAQLITSFGWRRSLKADAQGLLQLSLPWRGVYVLELQHADASASAMAGQPYTTTLSFHWPQGLESPARSVGP